jgi:hypothetical protein
MRWISKRYHDVLVAMELKAAVHSSLMASALWIEGACARKSASYLNFSVYEFLSVINLRKKSSSLLQIMDFHQK